MFKNFKYQDEAVNELLKKTFTIIRNQNPREKLLLEAPTGAGKTVVMAKYLKQFVETIDYEDDLPQSKFAFIWIAPNQLHEQSYNSIKKFFSDFRTLQAINFQDITDRRLYQNQILFFNWQSISSEENIYIRDNEQGRNLFNYLDNTRIAGVEIILILDEAHLFASKGKKATELLEKINATMEIDVSATPFFKSKYAVPIERRDVVAAEMIKKTVYLNDSLKSELQDDKFNIYLLNESLKKRDELHAAYRAEGTNLNPLLLIQLPSDTQTETDLDVKIKDLVITYLTVTKGISFNNGKLAIWLSKHKENLDDILKPDSLSDVLIFKQGISLGWDCPRAAILLIYRELKQFSFTVQTIGRIMRMPEQKHYVNDMLNYGYVYTNLNRDLIQIVKDEMQYSPHNISKRKNDIYQNLNLETSYAYTREFRADRLRSVEFYHAIDEVLQNHYKLKRTTAEVSDQTHFNENRTVLQNNFFFDLDISEININVIVDKTFSGDENELIRADNTQMRKFIRHADEIREQFLKFVRRLCTPYSVNEARGIVEKALVIHFIERYLDIDENRAHIFVLKNQSQITDFINEVYQVYEKRIEERKKAKNRDIEKHPWEVPEQLIYSDQHIEYPAEIPVMSPLFLRERATDRLADSDTEFEFIRFLESELMKPGILWWYKNGTKGKQHFALTYTSNSGKSALFYVDFVIMFRNQILALFDTKTINSDPEMTAKHNALIEYAETRSGEGNPTFGSIVLPKNNSWMICGNRVTTFDESLLGWDVLTAQTILSINT